MDHGDTFARSTVSSLDSFQGQNECPVLPLVLTGLRGDDYLSVVLGHIVRFLQHEFLTCKVLFFFNLFSRRLFVAELYTDPFG